MKRIAALFDCDGTLYAAQYGRGLMKYAAQFGHKWAVRRYYASLMIPYYLRKAKLIGEESYHRPLTSRMAWMVKGMSEEEFRTLSGRLITEYLMPTERLEVAARLRDHQSKGHIILLVSAQLHPSLEIFAEHYNPDGFIGTRLELKNGQYTGKIIPPVITGQDKERHARQFFSDRNIEVDWDASYAYADSITDTGLLGLAGHPVAVHPDEKLYVLALSNHWEMIGETRKIPKGS